MTDYCVLPTDRAYAIGTSLEFNVVDGVARRCTILAKDAVPALEQLASEPSFGRIVKAAAQHRPGEIAVAETTIPYHSTEIVRELTLAPQDEVKFFLATRPNGSMRATSVTPIPIAATVIRPAEEKSHGLLRTSTGEGRLHLAYLTSSHLNLLPTEITYLADSVLSRVQLSADDRVEIVRVGGDASKRQATILRSTSQSKPTGRHVRSSKRASSPKVVTVAPPTAASTSVSNSFSALAD